MKKYSSVIFDLFDTIILFKPELLPEVTFNGEKHHSTGKDVYKLFTDTFGEYDFERFYAYFLESYKKFQYLKNIDNREYPNVKRFEIMFELMGIDISDKTVLNKFVETHMETLSKSMILPDAHRDILYKLIERNYSLSLLSNFDHGPTAYKLLDEYSIRGCFNYIFISDEIGWRKPSKKIFDVAVNTINRSKELIVFIGDDYEKDIIGANEYGLDAIWVNRNADKPYPAKFLIDDLTKVLDILQ